LSFGGNHACVSGPIEVGKCEMKNQKWKMENAFIAFQAVATAPGTDTLERTESGALAGAGCLA
jgi:hypothetical protein